PDPQPFKSFKPAVSRIYRPKTPFPPTQMKAKRKLKKAICKKAFDKIINTLTGPERNIFSIDDRADEYPRLMDARKEAMRVDKEEDDD
ncbi:unnamed protein product, partial [Brassica oleracea]